MRWHQRADGAIRSVMATLLPGRCAGCGRAAEPVCAACAEGLRSAPHLRVPAGLDGCAAAFAYEGVAREVVARLKYRNERAAVPWLARAMVATHRDGPGRVHEVGFVTWVPASAARRRAMGFDHGELLARAVGRDLRLPAAGVLTREHGGAQTGRSRAQRLAGPGLHAVPQRARGRSVLLVDDVLTTGATLSKGAAALRRGGAVRVVGLTAAATPEPGR